MSLEAFQLNGKNALVTGSHKGLGAAIAVALAKAGANVGCHGRDPNPGSACDEVRAAGFKTFYFSGDLADAKVPAAEYPAEFWDELIAVNLTAVFRLSQLAARHMLERGTGGKVLNIASLLSFQGGILVPAYAAAKGGVVQLTKEIGR